MNKIVLIVFSLSVSAFSFGQAQIGNGDMEAWETVASDQEPVNWNSFLTAGGSLSSFAVNQIASSTDVRPGTTGTLSCKIWSRNVFTIVANGNVTLGKINMGSTTATSTSNYNASVTADAAFSEAMADAPDSLVFWAKFTPVSGGDIARVKATLHDSYDYRDPEDAASMTHVVATAVLNYPTTNGSWKRFSIPFNYSGPATGNTHILLTFTTNEVAGGGSGNDEVLIDDVELIYNPSGINGITNKNTFVSMDNSSNRIHISSSETINGNYEIYDMKGNVVQNGAIANELNFEHKTGMYIVVLNVEGQEYNFKIMKN